MPLDEAYHENRIGGRAVRPAGQGRFEPRAALGGGSLGSWPRSGPDDVRAALEALERGRRELAQRPAAERRERALAALDALGEDAALARWLAQRLGVAEHELAPHRADLARRAAARVPPAADDEEHGASVLVLDWSELLLGAGAAAAGELAAGRALLLLADARVPALFDALAAALERAGLPGGAVAVLHGADAALLRAAVRAREVRRALVSGPPARLRAVRAAAAARPSDAPLDLLESAPRGRALRLGADAPARAADVARAAFSRAATLSGQLPGRVETVLCPPRAFSAFTEALLAALDADPDVLDPAPLIDAEALALLNEVRGRGLDEGATLIRGGAVQGTRDAPRVAPLLFTNVEPGMRLCEESAPGPLLRLVRAPDEPPKQP